MDAARKTLRSVKSDLDSAIRFVSDSIYPNLQTYGINTTKSSDNSLIVVDFVGGKSEDDKNSFSSIRRTFKNYLENPYISSLVVIESGLRIQMKFVSNNGVSSSTGTKAKVPIFEPFFGRRILLTPIFNIKYDNSGNVTAQDREIIAWECLSDADELISMSGTTIAEGMRSVVSIAGGELGSCQYLTASSLNRIWANVEQDD
ncbi:hypothetical protein phytr_6410 [Candidatus Phycorickettsia trachydisci]|uniref:Uncharacterized protein n=1 Tax=Candidatus Phycorickettsia trachydisci TaxID=2115978 RepID=A0A2P1P8I1_9RICK|nr:hypothetical protein [Candidatus Phycorickettsia trachydisci]AVP87582.1 hypothetical protein phytr_6410 [Candidatus Phycorickettsia trachydisci]